MTTAPATGGDVRLAWYLVALVAYIAAGLFLTSAVLNWIVGPLFPLAALYLVPALARRLRRAKLEPAE